MKEIQSLPGQGKGMDAFEKLCNNDVNMIEVSGAKGLVMIPTVSLKRVSFQVFPKCMEVE